MIIDKLAQRWTAEERQKLEELEREREARLAPANIKGKPQAEINKALEEAGKVIENINTLFDSVARKYVEERGDKGLLEDIKEIVASLTKEDFLEYVAHNKEVYINVELVQNKANLPYDEGLETIRKMTVESYDNCYDFILRQVRVQVQALLLSGKYIDKVEAIIEERVEGWYPQPHYVRQGTVTNALTKLKAKKGESGKNIKVDKVGNATITSGDMVVKITGFSNGAGLRTSTHQFFDMLTEKLTETGAKSPTIHFTLDEYMKKRGLTDRKEAKKQSKEEMETLRAESFRWEEKQKDGTVAYAFINIADSGVIKRNGDIEFTFGNTLYKVYLGLPVMYYPQPLYRLNNKRNPNSYYFGRKITELKNMNVGKENEDIVSVKTLINSSPYLPTYEAVMETDKHLTQRIIEPFERDMDALGDIFTWEYCHSKGKPLTDAELETMSYDTFINLLVKTSWKYYPDQTARLQRKAERIEQAKTARKRAPKKK